MLTILNLSFEAMHIAIVGIFILLEVVFIKKRKKAEWIFPLVILTITLAFCIHMSIATSSRNAPNLVTYPLDEHSSQAKVTILVSAKSEEVLAVGQITAGDVLHREYINLDIHDNKVVGTKKALPYKKGVENQLRDMKVRFTGTSLKCQEIEDIYHEMYIQMSETKFSFLYFIFNLIRYMLPVMILPLMYLISRYRRKKKNTLKKIKLEDL